MAEVTKFLYQPESGEEAAGPVAVVTEEVIPEESYLFHGEELHLVEEAVVPKEEQ